MADPEVITEYGAAYKSGDVQMWVQDDEYPIERRIPNYQKHGGIVLTRKVIVVEDWHEVPPA